MEEADQDLDFDGAAHAALPPAVVTLAPFSYIPSPSRRRLSSLNFTQSSRSVPPPPKNVAWLSLQGRLVNAEEASSARAIGGGLSREEAVAWELFSPIQRFLLVAVIGVAVAESKKNQLIWQLTKSVELRCGRERGLFTRWQTYYADQVLSSMQQKLDGLCEQVNNVRDHSGAGCEMAITKNSESPCIEVFGSDKIKFVDCGCWLCDQHRDLYKGFVGNSVRKSSGGDEDFQYKLTFSNDAEPEERRMSDLSDWASSVTSSAEIQMNTLAIEQDVDNLKRDCEEKEATIKELTTLLHSSDVAGLKRIAELEDIIRRKNTIITKLKKDMVVLEQKVVHFTRLRRSSFPASNSSTTNSGICPHMADNLLYDLDSTTSPSSSDSDCSPVDRPHVLVAKLEEISIKNSNSASTRSQMSEPAKSSCSFERPTDKPSKFRSITLDFVSANTTRPFGSQESVSCKINTTQFFNPKAKDSLKSNYIVPDHRKAEYSFRCEAEKMAEVAGLLVSPFLQVFFERLASREFVDFFRRRKLDNGLLKKLEITLLSVNAVLEDAEEKQVASTLVKKWLDELKDVVFDAEDILDEIDTEALRSKLDDDLQSTSNKVRKYISSSLNRFAMEIELKIKEVLERLDHLVKQKDVIGLKEGIRAKSSEKATTSLIQEFGICGRNEDKEIIISSLLSKDVSDDELRVIAVVGMGGIGKTTLAQLVYNDNRVMEHFDLKAWVCVSNEFDVFRMTKIILKTVGSTDADSENLDWLQVTLKEKLVGKKFLLVLDDVWNENYADWEVLSNPFKSGRQGSRVLVTTREERFASAMHPTLTYPLSLLSEEDCWSLFVKHAFRDGNSNAHPELEITARQIVKKCEGLPLAAKTIGCLLWSKLDVDEWKTILKSDLWDFPDIIPALRLSYKYLPSHLKRCFAYCSIFPQDYRFKKDTLILLWMAEGFLQQSKEKTMEQVGEDYFTDLVSRSLFQKSCDDEFCFVMHDLVNDLARFVSGQFCFRLEGDSAHEIGNKTRHFSTVGRSFDYVKKLETLYKAKGLRTFLPVDDCYKILTKELSHDLLQRELGKLANLKGELTISELQNVESPADALDASLKNMKHLQQLALEWNTDSYVTSTISDSQGIVLDSLQPHTNLKELTIDKYAVGPEFYGSSSSIKPFGALKHLQFFDLPEWEKWSSFGDENGGGTSFSHLEKLEIVNCPKLTGALSIHLPSLAKLKIANCPQLVASLPRAPALCELELSNCKEVPLKEFPAGLQKLAIGGYDALESNGSLLATVKDLRIWDCRKLEFPMHVNFSSLETLELINSCHSLRSLQLNMIPKLKTITISGCMNLESLEQDEHDLVASSIRIEACPDFVSFPKGGLRAPELARFRVMDCPRLRSLPHKMHVFLPCLENLVVRGCPQIESFPKGGLPTTLISVSIIRCDKLVASRKSWGFQKLPSLTALQITGDSENIKLFPEAGLLPTSLTFLCITHFQNMESLHKKGLQHLNSLRKLEIRYCHKFKFMPEEGLPDSLRSLEIEDCPLLEKQLKRRKGKEWCKIAHIPSIRIGGELIWTI
ncbi:putative disease resistance RPP13-like protein 1 [Morella rubra]|uniref:Putative disease resistance RPP13-like protein 1 n=1 Tax=Morella rubra TaxID=262757 RepID=A0A6A1WR91_9ROSI|nr:putative disease resistance RPP13-like protein 1 [Morella rubra]